MNRIFRIFFGAFLLLLGLSLLLEQFGFSNAIDIWFLFGLFWPALIIVIGFTFFTRRNKTIGIIFLIIGLVLLFSHLFSINIFAVAISLIILFIGFSIITGQNFSFNSTSTAQDPSVDSVTLFWGSEKRIESKNFKSGNIICAFGGVKYDLRNATITKNGAKIDVQCAFGGVEILVPKDCIVKVNGMGILGGWDNKTRNGSETNVDLTVTGIVAFGGVEVK